MFHQILRFFLEIHSQSERIPFNEAERDVNLTEINQQRIDHNCSDKQNRWNIGVPSRHLADYLTNDTKVTENTVSSHPSPAEYSKGYINPLDNPVRPAFNFSFDDRACFEQLFNQNIQSEVDREQFHHRNEQNFINHNLKAPTPQSVLLQTCVSKQMLYPNVRKRGVIDQLLPVNVTKENSDTACHSKKTTIRTIEDYDSLIETGAIYKSKKRRPFRTPGELEYRVITYNETNHHYLTSRGSGLKAYPAYKSDIQNFNESRIIQQPTTQEISGSAKHRKCLLLAKVINGELVYHDCFSTDVKNDFYIDFQLPSGIFIFAGTFNGGNYRNIKCQLTFLSRNTILTIDEQRDLYQQLYDTKDKMVTISTSKIKELHSNEKKDEQFFMIFPTSEQKFDLEKTHFHAIHMNQYFICRYFFTKKKYKYFTLHPSTHEIIENSSSRL